MGAPALLGLAGSGQGGHLHAPTGEAVLLVLVIVALSVATALIAIHLRRAQRRPRTVSDEWQARAEMGELCPFGWKAQVTFRGPDAPGAADAPCAGPPVVELEWQQFDELPGRVAVARRVVAPDLAGALQAMVEDRRTHAILDRIEQALGEVDDAPDAHA